MTTLNTTAKTATVVVAKTPNMSEVDRLRAELQKANELLHAATVEAERARNARGVSTMQVIRKTLAGKTTATVAEIRDACKAAGVPARSDATIKTIMSDFRQTYEALKRAGRIS
jgi:hypothetical protein